MEKKPNITIKVSGCVAAILIAVATFFKLMHWPGANISLILVSISFLFFYLPLWLINELKQGRKLTTFYQFILLFITGLSLLFKTLHWPGAGIIFNIWIGLTLYVVFPIGVYQLFRNTQKTLRQFHAMMVLFLLVPIIIAGVGGAASGMNRMASSFSKNTEQMHVSIDRLKIKNQKLYSAFEQLENRNNNPYYLKAEQLKVLSDSTARYIRHLRNHLIAISEQVRESTADSMEVKDIRDKANSGTSTEILCGWDTEPVKGKYSGLELRSIIEMFRDSVIGFVDGENKNFIKAGINLETEPGVDENGEPLDWVFATFQNIPLSAVLLTLESMQYEVKNAETQVLSDLLNNASKNSGNNLASKIADLGFKLENEKKQHEIENLHRERELSQLRLNSKNAKLNEQQQTIAFFVLGLIICSVMIFFIVRSNLIRRKINAELNLQKQEIEHKNKEITDSINYAKRIQQAILPPVELVYSVLKDSFVLYKPKDVVSGDFYGFIQREDQVIIIAADCTGHGVPGAFMSMIGNDQLNNIINEKKITEPAKILDELHKGIRGALKQDQSHGQTRDGMDIALCKINLRNNKLEYAGAMRPLWLVRQGKLMETKADKQPIGGLDTEGRKPFTNHTIDLQKDDCIYIFTDGYADQFGGEKGKKFMVKNFEKMLLEINTLSMAEQSKLINEKFEIWKANNEQVDDVLVIGIKI